MTMEAFEIKRFIDFWKGDNKFRTLFLDNPSAALKDRGIHHGAESLHPFCLEQYKNGNLRLQGIKDIPGMEAYRSLLHQRSCPTLKKHAANFTNYAFNSWRLRQINYFRTQVPDEWAAHNPHLPIAVELTHGCSMSCPFCAGAADPLNSNIPSYHEYTDQFSSLLTRIKRFFGLKKSHGLLYFFTEPFDHPDYEDFLCTAINILNGYVRTTTAAWHLDIPRTRAFLGLVQQLGIPYNRFSINSKKLFHKCMEDFSPQELVNVGLVCNYPQAAESILYAAGRGKKISNAILGSVACVTGFIVNLPLQRIQLVSPTLEIDKWPKGYRVLAESFGLNEKDVEAFLCTCNDQYFNTVLHADSKVKLREDLSLTSEGDQWYLINHYRRFCLKSGEERIVDSLSSTRKVKDFIEMDFPGFTANQIYARLSTLWANGLLEDSDARNISNARRLCSQSD